MKLIKLVKQMINLDELNQDVDRCQKCWEEIKSEEPMYEIHGESACLDCYSSFMDWMDERAKDAQ